MSEMEYQEAIRRASEAAHIIEHPMVVEAFNALRADAYAKIESTKPSQQAEREFLYQRLQAIASFETQFQFHIDEGRVASSFLDKLRAEKITRKRRAM